MTNPRWQSERVFIYRHPVDFRKAIGGLSAIVVAELGGNPADGSLYVFTNRGRDKIKLLIWDRNGFWMLYKSLVRQRFKWPDWFNDDVMTLSQEHLDLLIDGYNLNGMRPHQPVNHQHVL